MNIRFLSLVLLASFLVFTAQGQKKLPKKEYKKWKAKLKKTSPEQYKTLYESYNVLTTENSALKNQVASLEQSSQSGSDDLAQKTKQVAALKKNLSRAKSIITDLKSQLAEKGESSGTSNGTGEDFTKGIVYKVQIGAFRDPKLSKFTATGNWWEEEADGLKKYTIGYFRDYWEADLFKKYIRKMGVKDAWVVAYEDNVRKDIKSILATQGKK